MRKLGLLSRAHPRDADIGAVGFAAASTRRARLHVPLAARSASSHELSQQSSKDTNKAITTAIVRPASPDATVETLMMLLLLLLLLLRHLVLVLSLVLVQLLAVPDYVCAFRKCHPPFYFLPPLPYEETPHCLSFRALRLSGRHYGHQECR